MIYNQNIKHYIVSSMCFQKNHAKNVGDLSFLTPKFRAFCVLQGKHSLFSVFLYYLLKIFG